MAVLRRLCVFCGARSGRGERYIGLARDVGRLLAAYDIELVYGGARDGCMGALAEATLKAGGQVQGVMPRSLRGGEGPHQALTQLHWVDTMHQRKALMAELADGFIALPGGFGTLDELFEIATWSQLGLHQKPVGILNGFGYYDSLLSFLNHSQDEGFATAQQCSGMHVAESPLELLERFGVTRAVRQTA